MSSGGPPGLQRKAAPRGRRRYRPGGLSVAAHDEFTALDEFSAELLVYCYRMLGSAEEAEDVVQETYLRAWRSYAGFEGRSSVRTWLYRIATNACLTAIERRGRRPLPSGLGGPSDESAAPDLRALLDRFAAAFEDGDVTALAALLREDVALEMPPLAPWFSGREPVLGFVASNLGATAGRTRLVPARPTGSRPSPPTSGRLTASTARTR